MLEPAQLKLKVAVLVSAVEIDVRPIKVVHVVEPNKRGYNKE